MAGFTSRDGIINAITTLERQETRNFFKNATANTQGTVAWISLLSAPGAPGAATLAAAVSPGTGYDTSTGAAPTTPIAALSGSTFFGSQSPLTRYLTSFGAVLANSNGPITLMLYDRLVAVGGVSIATTGTKTVNSTALTRYTGTQSTLNEVWLEVTTATGAAAAVGTMIYVDGAGATQTTTSSWAMPAGASPATTMIPVPLLSTAAPGVRSVTSITANTASAAGVVNVVILRPIARIPLGLNLWNEVSFLDDPMGLPRIYDNATLCLAATGFASTGFSVYGTLSTVYN